MPGWPKLAWVARVPWASRLVEVRHGTAVERREDWCAEAAWPDAFEDGGLDATDLVVGTGVRLRDDAVVFVTASDTLSRLYTFQDEAAIVVSNSLPCLLATTGAALVEGFDYAGALGSIVQGPLLADKAIPTTRGPIGIVYLDNVRVTGDVVTLVAKPALAPAFTDFATYRDYLFDSARAIGRNVSAQGRAHAVTPAATISSGYDSPAAAVVGRAAGVRSAFTLRRAQRKLTTWWDTDDSGEAIAHMLGLSCTARDRSEAPAGYEDFHWAALGNAGDMNLSAFDYPAPVCLLFNGCMGDILWDRHRVQTSFLSRKDTSGARFSEARLEHGVLVCSPVFWGWRHEDQILALAHLPEMAPWTLGTRYDRPLPRRILEEAGVPRGAFARSKKASAFSRRVGRPRSPELWQDFARFATERGRRPRVALGEALAYVLDGIDYYALQRLPRPLRFSCKDWAPIPSPTDFFLWANERLVRRYQQ